MVDSLLTVRRVIRQDHHITPTDPRRITMSAPSSDSAAIRQVIRALLAAGYTLDSVNDGDELIQVKTETEALDAITAVDEATLFVLHPEHRSSHVYFVMGNDPEEVVCDHGVSLSPVLDPLTQSWWD